MPAHVKVYPAKASALNVKHPHGPKMALGGVTWPKDSFTGRRLSDGSVTENEAKAYRVPEETPASSANSNFANPPSPATTTPLPSSPAKPSAAS